MRGVWWIAVLLGWCLHAANAAAADKGPLADIPKLRAAIEDLSQTYPDRYPNGSQYLARLSQVEQQLHQGSDDAQRQLQRLRREALLANPLLQELNGLLLVKRKPKTPKEIRNSQSQDSWVSLAGGLGREIAMPSNHECNASLERDGYDNEICLLAPVSSAGDPAHDLST